MLRSHPFINSDMEYFSQVKSIKLAVGFSGFQRSSVLRIQQLNAERKQNSTFRFVGWLLVFSTSILVSLFYIKTFSAYQITATLVASFLLLYGLEKMFHSLAMLSLIT